MTAAEPTPLERAAVFTPVPIDARMDGYYIGFDRTGVDPIDAILSAVAIAGKGSHSTDGWTEGDESTAAYYSWYEYLPDAENALDLIQKTAERSAAEVRALLAGDWLEWVLDEHALTVEWHGFSTITFVCKCGRPSANHADQANHQAAAIRAAAGVGL